MQPGVQGYPLPGTLDDVLGFELFEATGERCRGRFSAEKRVQQPMGLVHGGVYAALAETMASWATSVGVQEADRIVMGQSNSTHFLRPVTSGSVHAEGTPRHRGRTSWIWDIDFTDDEGRVCAMTRVTIAVRPASGSRSPRSGS
jgi:1,4-dihydroxy-2-naphthoyl-CoA hydrolase